MSGRPAATAPRPYRFPDFARHELANGLRVWLVPLPDRELVSVHLLTDAGASSEDEEEAGIAALDTAGDELLLHELEERRPRATFVVATHDPVRLERLATARLSFA